MISRRLLFLVAAGYFFLALTAISNIGFIALDDYAFGVARTIPAQFTSFEHTIADRGFRFPFQALILTGLGKWALTLGLENPVHQFRFVLLAIGSLVFFLHVFSVLKLFKKDAFKQEIAVALLSFYFLCPLIFSRPLIENMSGPFLTLSALFATSYYLDSKRFSLIGAVFFVMVAALFRYQSGVCFLVLPVLALLKKDSRGFLLTGLLGGLAFLLSGFLDLGLTGSFHGSLKAYVDYNIQNSSSFGVTPFYSFTLLFLALSIPPTFFKSYGKSFWLKEYKLLFPTLLYFLVFLVAHSAIPHKEERFMVPVLTLFLILLVPLVGYEIKKTGSRWRLWYFTGVNLVLLPLASFNIPQNNSISLVTHVAKSPLNSITGVADTLVLFPEAFSLKPIQHQDIPLEKAKDISLNCQTGLAIRKDYAQQMPELFQRFLLEAEFAPGFLEAVVVKLNPKQNARRGSILLFTSRDC